jgi:hypothetical protein
MERLDLFCGVLPYRLIYVVIETAFNMFLLAPGRALHHFHSAGPLYVTNIVHYFA